MLKESTSAGSTLKDILHKDFERLDVFIPDRKVGERAVRFVVDDTDDSCLLEIAGVQNRELHEFLAGSKTVRWDALDALADAPATTQHRFARLMLAAAQACGALTGWNASRVAGPDWLRAYWLTSQCRPSPFGAVGRPKKSSRLYGVATLMGLFEAAKEPLDGLIEYLYGSEGYHWQGGWKEIEGRDALLRDERERVAAVASKLDADARCRLLADIAAYKLGALYGDLVFAWAVDNAKTLRVAAQATLADLPAEDLFARAARVLESGAAAERYEMVLFLKRAAGALAGPLLEAHLEKESTKRVRDAVSEALGSIEARHAPAVPEGAFRTIDGTIFQIPPMPELPPDTPLPATAMEPLRRTMLAHNAWAEEDNARRRGEKYFRPVRMIDEREIGLFLDVVNITKTVDWVYGDALGQLFHRHGGQKPAYDTSGVDEFLAQPALTLWHCMRRIVLQYKDRLEFHSLLDGNHWVRLLFAPITRALQSGLDFRVIVAMFEASGYPAAKIVEERLARWHERTPLAEYGYTNMWLAFANHPELIEEALGLRPSNRDWQRFDEGRALTLLSELEHIPERYLDILFDVAIGDRKKQHAAARKLLRLVPGLDQRIVNKLADAKRETRTNAATWLAERGCPEAVAPIEAALAKEKDMAGRAALLSALDTLGHDISGYFDEKALKAEASKGLKAAKPGTLDWFPFDALPKLKWAGGKTVPPEVIRWWIVLADKLKAPEGNALFALYLDRMQPDDAARLGRFLIAAFIARDTVRPTIEDVTPKAEAHARATYQNALQHYSATWPDWLPPRETAYDVWLAQCKRAMLADYLHSAAANKGLLGLATRAPGVEAAAQLRGYLKEHGPRVNQSKALLSCLGANPSLAAIQGVLAAANRLKQKTVQAHAKTIVEAIAEARGWTAAELADRTIPTGGFDESGEMVLDCGQDRTFTAVYLGDGKIELRNPAGKAVKGLPDARGETEAETIKESKKALSNTRKEVKQVITTQTSRLYEAMCVGRSWAPGDWQAYLVKHPIAGPLCQRLIWLGLDDDGKIAASFRPLEDRTLTDIEDASVVLDGLATVSLAHQAIMGPELAKAWETHLADYEITPLFTQVGRTVKSLDPAMAEATEIGDREGFMIDNLKLRSAVSKLGYDRGEVGDGGSFSEYVKRFEDAGLRALIGFTWSYVGENEQRPVALTKLTFERLGRGANRAFQLKDVPPVLLSETWNDLHTVAAASTGFDPEWRKKANW